MKGYLVRRYDVIGQNGTDNVATIRQAGQISRKSTEPDWREVIGVPRGNDNRRIKSIGLHILAVSPV